ncbi:MAG: TVP38/TMEM64 family protein [Spirochaetia bacterium]|nr:TVP38/TMEM64 family protein [Spirochaetia bacterium]
MKKWLKPALLILIVASVILIIRFTSLNEYLNFQKLYEGRDNLLEYVKNYYVLSVIIYILVYFAVVALSIPGATILTILGGFFFGPWAGTLFVNIGATFGAFAIFLIARFFLGESLQKKYEKQLGKFNKEIAENGKSYMLTLRLIPIFPFFLINILAGLTTLPAITFLWTTALGIIPGSFVYSYIGYAGTSMTESQGVFTPQILIALILLSVLSLVPVVAKKIKASKKDNKSA